MPVKSLIKRLHSHLEYMCDLAERQLDSAVMALVDGNPALAEEVLTVEEEMDAMDLQVTRLAQEALENLKPEGDNFRYVVSAMRVSSYLERIGDFAADTARQARGKRPGRVVGGEALPSLVDQTEVLVRDAVSALVSGEAASAWSVIEKSGDARSIGLRAVEAIEKALEDGRVDPKRAVYLLLVAFDLGRIEQLAVSIAEEVIYMVENRLVKHVGRMMLEARNRRDVASSE